MGEDARLWVRVRAMHLRWQIGRGVTVPVPVPVTVPVTVPVPVTVTVR